MPSAANGKSEKPASSEALDNSPVRQIMTIVEHKIRNLEKRKSKLTSYRDLQKAGKELKPDQKIAVAKFDEVNQTLEFARELSKQISAVAVSAEREEKKKAKKDAWLRYAAEADKIREALIIVDCLNQMGSSEAREDFLSGTNGAAKLTEADLKVLDDLYPEVTPKHEPTADGKPGFPGHVARAAEHLCSIVDGRAKEALGTTYTHIRQIVASVHASGYFDKLPAGEVEEVIEEVVEAVEEEEEAPPEPEPAPAYSALPAPAYPPCAPCPPCPPCPPCLPPITLQEVEHAYFAHQYPQQPRPIADVIGSQNFFFLQESELDSPGGTPAPVPLPVPLPDPALVPTQTFTNQHFVLRAAPPGAPPAAALPCPPCFPPAAEPAPAPTPAPAPAAEWDEGFSPERHDTAERKPPPAGDARVYTNNGGGGRRYNNRAPRPSNGYRGGRGGYAARPAGDYREPRAPRDGYAARPYGDGYRGRARDAGDGYCGNGDSGNGASDADARHDRYEGGFKSRGRGGPRGSSARGPPAPRGPRPQHYRNKPDAAE